MRLSGSKSLSGFKVHQSPNHANHVQHVVWKTMFSIVLSELARMRIGVGSGFRVFLANFRPGFKELLFVSIALAVVETFVNFDRNELMSHED